MMPLPPIRQVVALIGLLSLTACAQAGTPPPNSNKPRSAEGFQRTSAALTAPHLARAPQPAQPASRAGNLAVRLVLPWGQAPGQVGHRRDAEAMPEGPMALDVAPDGRIAVLDQVNGRVQVFAAGQPVQILPIPRDTFQDVAFDDAGRLFALDRLGVPEVVALTGGGLQVRTVGEGLDEGAAATGLFPMADGVWVESEHHALVHIADAQGQALTERTQVPGRVGQTGRQLVVAAVTGQGQVTVRVREPTGAVTFTAQLQFTLRLDGIREVAVDAQGQTLVVVAQARDEADRTVESRLTAVVLDVKGQELRRTELPPPAQPDEQFRPVRLGPDGALYLLQCGADAATVLRVQP